MKYWKSKAKRTCSVNTRHSKHNFFKVNSLVPNLCAWQMRGKQNSRTAGRPSQIRAPMLHFFAQKWSKSRLWASVNLLFPHRSQWNFTQTLLQIRTNDPTTFIPPGIPHAELQPVVFLTISKKRLSQGRFGGIGKNGQRHLVQHMRFTRQSRAFSLKNAFWASYEQFCFWVPSGYAKKVINFSPP